MAENKIFLGFKQVKSETFESVSDRAGYLWFVRNPETGAGDIYFGNKHYGSYDPSVATDLDALKTSVEKILTDIGYNDENGLEFADALSGETTFVGAINKLVSLVEEKADADNVYTKDEVDTTLAKYVANTTLETYKGEVADALAEKLVAADLADYAKSADVVANTAFEAYTAATDAALAKKVEVESYEAKVEEIEGAIATKLDVSAHTAYTAATDAALAKKVETETYEAKVEEIGESIAEVKKSATEANTWIGNFMKAEELGQTAIDTLSEIQAYIDSDKQGAAAMTAEIANKVAKADYEAKVAEIEGAVAKKVEVESYEAKVEEIEGAIATKVAQADYEAKVAEIEKTIEDNELVVSEALTNLSDNKANLSDVVLKEGYVAYSEEEKTKLAGVAENAQVNVIEKVTLFGNELTVTDKTVAVDFQSDDIKLGTAITTTEDGETKEVFGADKTLSQTLQGIYDSLKSGLSGGVTSVTGADDSIVVSGDINNREVKVQISAAANNRLSLRTVDGEKGLYVEPLYYDGDDSEVE